MANRKTHIFLAGDSTVQSYASDMYPPRQDGGRCSAAILRDTVP